MNDPGAAASPAIGQAEHAVAPGRRLAQIIRYGPGVPAVPPADRAELTAEHVWSGKGPAAPARRLAKLRGFLGSALTVVLLVISGVLLYLRFHHAPFQVTGVVISQQTQIRCGADVTGRIATNGAAGTVSYQWLFETGLQPPRPLSQSVAAGQRALYVTVAAEGTGRGSASQAITLQVLGPELMAASTAVVITCR